MNDHRSGSAAAVAWLLSAWLLIAAMGASAQVPEKPQLQVVPGLGALVFATSTSSAEAQAAFIRGALLLHLFEYNDAAKAFQQAEKLDPDFAMAYWGEAMTHNHGIWNKIDEQAGRAVLRKLGATPALRATQAPTARERAYLASLDILYDGQGSKLQRDARYAQAMQQLAKENPQDNQAQLFYALALLARSGGVRDVPTYLQAADISQGVFRKNPKNPGAAHYWIHGMDDPEHAAGALEAARELSKIAPDAGHAQHMTSHIFMALGLWDDVETANLNAARVVAEQRKAAGKPPYACGHYNEWLQYTWFQQGRHADGLKVLQSCHVTGGAALGTLQGKEADAFAESWTWSQTMMRARAVIGSQDWNGAAAKLQIEIPQGSTLAVWDLFATGFAASARDDAVQAQQALSKMDALIASAKPDPTDLQETDYLHILRDDLAGMIASKAGNNEQALLLVRRAAVRYDGLAFDFGPPVPVKPPHELLGELLMAAGQPQAAEVEFETALKRAPMRARSLLGLARAQVAAGNADAARVTYGKLLGIWHAADSDLPALAEARRHTMPAVD